MESIHISITVGDQSISFTVPGTMPPKQVADLTEANLIGLLKYSARQRASSTTATQYHSPIPQLQSASPHEVVTHSSPTAATSRTPKTSWSSIYEPRVRSRLRNVVEALGDQQPTATELPVLVALYKMGGRVRTANDLLQYLQEYSDFDSRAKDPGGSVRYHLRNLVEKKLVARSEEDDWALTTTGSRVAAIVADDMH